MIPLKVFIIVVITINILIAILALITKTKFLDYFKPKRWKSFISYLAKKWLIYSGEIKTGEEARVLTKSELIQYGYRFAKCYECIIKGNCINCNCNAIGRVNNKTDVCSLKKFGLFLEDQELENLIKEGIFDNLEIIVKE